MEVGVVDPVISPSQELVNHFLRDPEDVFSLMQECQPASQQRHTHRALLNAAYMFSADCHQVPWLQG